MAGGLNRKEVLGVILNLAEAQYDTITNLQNMTLQELSDIYKVIISKQQEKALADSRKTNKIKGQL